MTDERINDLLGAVARLPKGSGIVFRHYATEAKARRMLFDDIRVVARRRRLVLLLADTPDRAKAWGADGAHHHSMLRSIGLRTVAAHNPRELRVARLAKADLILVSPVFSTRSHAGARALGPVRTGLMAASLQHRIIALGGMNTMKFKRLRGLGLHGWAAIDAFG